MSVRASLCCFVMLLAPAGVLAGPDGDVEEPKPINVFEGRVVDHADHKPVAGAKVVVADTERGFLAYHGHQFVFAYAPNDKVLFFFTKRNGRRSAEVTTDSDGRFVIKGLVAGQYALIAVHPGRGVGIREDVKQPNAGDPLEVVLDPPTFAEATIRGLAGGDTFLQTELVPVDHVGKVVVRPGFVDETSVFSAMGAGLSTDGTAGPLPAGLKWAVSAHTYVAKRGFSAPLLSMPVDIETGKVNKLEIDLTKGEKLTGEVHGPKGEPLKDVSVVLKTTDKPAYEYGAVTDDKGKYLLTGLRGGDYTLEAKRWARRTAPG